MTKREQIMEAIKTALAGISGVNDANIFRSRTIPYGQAQLPAISIEPLAEEASSTVHRLYDWTLGVRITIGIKSKIPDKDADDIMSDVHEKLIENSNLYALIQDISITSNNFSNYDADGGFGMIEMNYAIKYRTSENSLT